VELESIKSARDLPAIGMLWRRRGEDVWCEEMERLGVVCIAQGGLYQGKST